MRTYAFIRSNMVITVGVLADEEAYRTAISEWQAIVDIEDQLPRPEAGWLLEGSSIVPPTAISSDPVEYIKYFILRPAKKFAADLEEQFVAENIAMGITQAGKTDAVAAALVNVTTAIRSLSLYSALTAIAAVNITPELSPFLTAPRLQAFANKIRAYLKIPLV